MHKNTITVIAAIIAVLLPFTPAKADYFRHLTLDDGLSQPSVMAIAQDKLGRIWLGTREGINIYDGVRITSYKGWVSSGSDNDRIWIGNEVSAIVPDSLGNIFIHIDKDIVKFDILSGRFSSIGTNGNAMALAGKNGEIVFAVNDSLFLKRTCDENARFVFTIPQAKPLTHLGVDSTNFYASTESGLYVYNRQTGKHNVLLPGIEIFSSFTTDDGTLWITALNKGLYRFAEHDTSPVLVSVPSAPFAWCNGL